MEYMGKEVNFDLAERDLQREIIQDFCDIDVDFCDFVVGDSYRCRLGNPLCKAENCWGREMADEWLKDREAGVEKYLDWLYTYEKERLSNYFLENGE